MNRCTSKARLTLLWFSPILFTLTVSGQVRVDNTSQYIKNGTFSWRIFVQADRKTLTKIKCVEYQLDPSFIKPVRQICSVGDPSYAFAESGEAVRSFTVRVTITFADREPTYIRHTLKLSQEITVTQQVRIQHNTSKVLDQSPFYSKVAIYVSAGNAKSYRLKIYENFGSQRALYESQTYSENVRVNFRYNGQPYVLRGYTKGSGSAFDLYCTVYREVIR